MAFAQQPFLYVTAHQILVNGRDPMLFRQSDPHIVIVLLMDMCIKAKGSFERRPSEDHLRYRVDHLMGERVPLARPHCRKFRRCPVSNRQGVFLLHPTVAEHKTYFRLLLQHFYLTGRALLIPGILGHQERQICTVCLFRPLVFGCGELSFPAGTGDHWNIRILFHIFS